MASGTFVIFVMPRRNSLGKNLFRDLSPATTNNLVSLFSV